MQLYISPTSPYARIPRIVAREKDLTDRIEEITPQTRIADSPYYEINPSGRIPYLVGRNSLTLEGSVPISAYFDDYDGSPILQPRAGPEFTHLEEMARSLLDGLATWVREIKRPERIQSTKLLSHEEARAERLVAWWEERAQYPALLGPLNLTQITLATALDLEHRLSGFAWREVCPALAQWQDAFIDRPSFHDTALPEGSLLG